MRTESTSLILCDGVVSGEFMLPEKIEYALTLAHGAGAGMNHTFMVSLAQSLAEKNIASLRFNFPYMENKKKRPDVPAIAHKTIDAAIKRAAETLSNVPLFVSGKSFGGRMSSQFLAMNATGNVEGIIFFGFPLHPAKKPSVDRAEHLRNISIPMLFLQGTRDELATWELIEDVCGKLQSTTLVKIEGADHAFKAGKLNTIEMLANATKQWMDQVVTGKGM